MKGYFNNAATTLKKPDGMYEYMADYMRDDGINVGRGEYASSARGSSLVFETRKKILSLMHAPENRTAVFTPSATIALNTIIFGLGLDKGDVVYISHFEHNAILRPLYYLEKSKGIVIRFLPMKNGSLFAFDLDAAKNAFAADHPKAVILSHVSNVVGLVAPVEEIVRLAKQHDCVTVVDGAQACGLVDVNLAYVDYYVFAGHKTLLGPMGIGGFICRVNSSLPAFILGGTGVDSANREMPATVPERFEAGTSNLMAIAGLSYSVSWISGNRSVVVSKEKENLQELYKILSRYDFLNIVSPFPKASSIISCYVNGYTSDEMGRVLAENGISVRSGLHCSPEAHKYLGTFPEGLIRFSISCFTGREDFDLLRSALDIINSEI